MYFDLKQYQYFRYEENYTLKNYLLLRKIKRNKIHASQKGGEEGFFELKGKILCDRIT